MDPKKTDIQPLEFSADRPISKSGEDKFQRYNFSKRIAQIIISRKDEDCLVLGIYGAWGEGKTSVLNFIEDDLKTQSEFIIIKFNPWRYGDENVLLNQFFRQFASALNANLSEGKEELGKIFKDYGKFLNINILGVNLGEAAEKAGEKMSVVSIETLKSRLEKIISDSKKKIVVIIDDIDRLDKTEIHSIFRLVKLNADFKNTTYILSFDEKMVSMSIGERFGSGDDVAGRNFLEKIIQVPLQIPTAQSSDLQEFCFELINKTLDGHNINLSKEDNDRYVINFLNNILFKLTTPRLAVRYSNALAFSVPVLSGEVNITDLLLIEAVKIFYPKHYELIKNHPTFFTKSYDDLRGTKDQKKVDEIQAHLDELSSGASKNEKAKVQELLIALFPLLKSAFQNFGFNDSSYNDWFKSKRIASEKYFSKFFTYSAARGDLSDIDFNIFLEEAKSESAENITKKLNLILDRVQPKNLLQKLRMLEGEYDWAVLKKMAEAIAAISNKFPKQDSFSFFNLGSPWAQAALFVYQVIINHNQLEQQLELTLNIIKNSKEFRFAHDVYRNFKKFEESNEIPFSEKQILQLKEALFSRMMKESEGSTIFEKFLLEASLHFKYLVERDRKKADKYVSEILNKNPEKVVEVIKSFAPYINSNSHPEPYLSDFTQEYYDLLTSNIDKNSLNAAIDKAYSLEDLAIEATWMNRQEITEPNLIRQFKYWYNLPEEKAVEETTAQE